MPTDPGKIELVEFVFTRFGLRSFADLGGVWGVEGGYTFFALESFEIDKAFLVDTDFTSTVESRKQSFPWLNLIQADLSHDSVVEQIERVDAVFFFDVLLHLVSPDWDEVIQKYARITNHILIYNRQFAGSKTVRLLDLGEEDYFDNVPHGRQEEPYRTVFDAMYEIDPKSGKLYRDVQDIWQWGIVNRDLIDVMTRLRFRQVYHKNHGPAPGLKQITNQAFVFKKAE